MRGVCQKCGDTKPLNALGVCAWRHGCEHRIFQHEERMRRLNAEFDRMVLISETPLTPDSILTARIIPTAESPSALWKAIKERMRADGFDPDSWLYGP